MLQIITGSLGDYLNGWMLAKAAFRRAIVDLTSLDAAFLPYAPHTLYSVITSSIKTPVDISRA
jgi:hypothetical protein